jgi:hypothetical protein
VIEELKSGIESVGMAPRLIPLIYDPKDLSSYTNPLLHVPFFYTLEKGGVVANFFLASAPSHFNVIYKNPEIYWGKFPSMELKSFNQMVDLQPYDTVLLWKSQKSMIETIKNLGFKTIYMKGNLEILKRN